MKRAYSHLAFCLTIALFLATGNFTYLHHTWTLAHIASATAVSPNTVTITAPTAGDLLVAGMVSSNTGITITAVAGSCTSTWTHAANSAASGTGDGSSDLWYCLNASAGTSVQITYGTGSNLGVVWDAHSTAGSIAVDSGATPSSNIPNTTDGTCTSCAGVPLTLGGNPDFIAAIAPCGGTCSGLTGTGWTADLAFPGGDGVAHGITSGSQNAPATWTQTSGTLVASAAAFQEAGSGGGGGGGTGGKSGFGGKSGLGYLEWHYHRRLE